MMYAQEKTIQVQGGMLIRRHLRKMLEGAAFSAKQIRWMEDKHWTYSIFSICGPEKDVSALAERISFWLATINAD